MSADLFPPPVRAMPPVLADLGLITLGTVESWAVTSPDDVYRYLLGRTWDATRPTWLFGMLNPSKARHDIADPTMRKCQGFTKRGGGGGFIIVNTMPFSATDPADVVRAHFDDVDVVNIIFNAAAIRWAVGQTLGGRRIVAWGRIPPKLKYAALTGQTFIRTLFDIADCFGTNQDGSPRHPLMLGYDTPIVPFGRVR